MKWQGGRQSDNFQDRRGMSGGQKFAIGGIGGVIILVIGFLMGGDPGQLMEQLQNANVGAPQTEQGEVQLTEEEKQLTAFSRTVLASTEDVWTKVFKDNGLTYQTADLVVYTGGTQTEGCGVGKASYGPFYCPGDHNVYLDLSFNEELQQKFGAKGEFALAYVIAHEVGHHIQNLVGTLNKTNQMRQQMSEAEYNKVSVMTELQADFYAGVWAHYVNQLSDIKIDYNDILDGMQAAEAVGDDKLQEQAQGYAVPESFTHGTSEQRARWFKKGYDTGDMKAGDTFSDRSLR